MHNIFKKLWCKLFVHNISQKEIELDYSKLSTDANVRVRSGIDWTKARQMRRPDGLMTIQYEINDDSEE